MGLFTITALTFREAWHKKLFWLALGLGLAFLILFAIGFHFIFIEITTNTSEARQGGAALRILETQVSGTFLMLGLYAINFLVVMMAALTSVGSVAGEISSHTIQTVAAKPLRRWEVILGKWFGLAVMLLFYIIFMVGGLILVVYLKSGYTPPHIIKGMSLLVLEGLIVLSVSIFGGTVLSTLANGVMVFMLYGIAFAGGWVEQIGSLMESDTAIQVGIIASLIMPSEAMWRAVADAMQPSLVRETGFSLFTAGSTPSSAMFVYAGLYLLVFLGLAMFNFQRRDL